MSVNVSIRKSFSEFSLSAEFQAGSETLGFLGASGSGKSLTLRCIAGLETPDEGHIIVGDRVFYDSQKGINLTAQQRKTALLFQNYMLFPNLTVAQNIKAGLASGISRQQAHEIVDEQLARFGLKGFGHRYPASLSGGQQQRVALARMLAAKPDILMLDEPFSALDAHLKSGLEQEMLELFDEFAGTILYISHDIDEAFRFCDRIAVVDEGAIRQIGNTDDILRRPTTLATLKVSGVKNISAAHALGSTAPSSVEASDWGLVLECGCPVPENIAWIGVCASFLREPHANHDEANLIDFTVRRIIDSRFERTLILDPGGLIWRKPITADDGNSLINAGDSIKVCIAPEDIYLISK